MNLNAVLLEPGTSERLYYNGAEIYVTNSHLKYLSGKYNNYDHVMIMIIIIIKYFRRSGQSLSYN